MTIAPGLPTRSARSDDPNMPILYFRELWNQMSIRGKITFPWDLTRGGCDAAGQVFTNTFTLLIAIEFFNCTSEQKALIASGVSLGQTLSVFYATYSHTLIRKRSLEAAIPTVIGGVLIICAAFNSGPAAYAVNSCLASLFLGLRTPVLTTIHRENYRTLVRGQVVSLILLVTALSSVLITLVGGTYLEGGIGRYPVLLVAMGIITIAGGIATTRFATVRTPRRPMPSPFSYFLVLKKDAPFVGVLISWFLFGMANLAMMPQRFEYVSQEQYGFSLSPGATAFVVGLVPEITRLIAVVPMGRLFDRMNFIVLRILINFFLLGFQVVFFTASSVWMLCVGSVLLGIGNAGGSVAWSLWVTKYATPNNTTKYMAMHTFFTGVRGIIGPFGGYWIAENYSIGASSWIASGLIAVSCVLLVLIETWGRKSVPHIEDIDGPSE